VKKFPSRAIVPLDQLSVGEKVERVLIGGDLSALTPEERVDYVKKVCLSVGVNHLTRPFEYILFKEPGSQGQSRLQLYANKSCTEQLRKIHAVSVIDHQQTIEGDYCHVQVKVQDRTGRTDFSVGSVALFKYYNQQRQDLSGTERCNAIMKASTKAKRRATLSICGLAFLDESELENVRVVGGVTPEGRIYRYPNADVDDEPPQLVENVDHGHTPGSEKAKMAEAALARVEAADAELKKKSDPSLALTVEEWRTRGVEEGKAEAVSKHEEAKPRGTIELVHSADQGTIIRGDIGDLVELIQKHCTATWREDWWHILPTDVPTIHAMGKQLNYRVVEIFPKDLPPKGKTERKETPKTTTASAGKSQSPGAEPFIVKGTIERVFVTLKGEKSFAMVTIKTPEGTKREAGCWDKDIYGYLDKGKGKEAEVFFQTKGQYTNITGLKRIGRVEFEHNKVPILNRDREPGAAGNLFQP
jgi:hypothetical protein